MDRDAPAELPLPSLPPRAAASHKGSFGSVLVLAGCRRYPGAAILAALGAGRMGAGLVQLAVPDAIVAEVVPAVPFAVMQRAASDADGAFDAESVPGLLAAAQAADAVVLGPGLGQGDGAAQLLAALVDAVAAPLVLDADALNLLAAAGPAELLARRPGPTVLTPHPGEFARLVAGETPPNARSAAALDLARALRCVVVLKGAGSVTTDGRRLRVETAGNPGMATGGMGDVLAGATGTLLAQLDDPAAACALAVHLHAMAGDLAARELGQAAVLPEDVAARLGRALDA
ncbi:MAG: NAD(P)H-hydrate dehydratase [Planctomycetota bacterium]|nr:MAG: NAD(P)H-hydrate dehydratase [Planctomycetota bacterium]